MYQKYKKYENAYLDQKYLTIQSGGFITKINHDNIFKTMMPNTNSELCAIISDIELIRNEGRHNLGIMFIDDEGKELFLKFNHPYTLLNEFIGGYNLSRLKIFYPHFINVYEYTQCYKNGRRMDVLVAQKGSETLWTYLCKHTYAYITKILPDYEEIVDNLDKIFTDTLEMYGVTRHEGNFVAPDGTGIYSIDISKYDEEPIKILKTNITNTYKDRINDIITARIAPAYYKFITEFVDVFIKNLRVIWEEFFLLDVLTLSYYGTFISDKKYDNFMINTETHVDGTCNHIEINFGPGYHDKAQIINTITWDNEHYEDIYIYPVDFGSLSVTDNMKTSAELKIKNIDEIDRNTINLFMHNSMQFIAYSDIDRTTNLKHILHSTGGREIHIRMTRQFSDNALLKSLHDKFLPFKINLPTNLDILTDSSIINLLKMDNLTNLRDIFMFVYSCKSSMNFGRFDDYRKIWHASRSDDIPKYKMDWPIITPKISIDLYEKPKDEKK